MTTLFALLAALLPLLTVLFIIARHEIRQELAFRRAMRLLNSSAGLTARILFDEIKLRADNDWQQFVTTRNDQSHADPARRSTVVRRSPLFSSTDNVDTLSY